MGNSQPGSVLTRTTVALDSFVAELGGDIIFEKSLGSARFLKTVKCRHKRGFLVVKIFVKPDPGISLRTYHRRLKVERDALTDLPNVYADQAFVETDKAGYIIRQWIASSLYDRISTRPFLSPIEKKWIAFQLLNALRDVRNRSLSHGDIKSENVFVTSWNWVYLCDFASSYKPTWLPLDDPADFSFYFDVAGRRACYIAPERFYAQGQGEGGSRVDGEKEREKEKEKEKERRRRGVGVGVGVDEMEGYGYGWKREGKVTEAMDVFSAGCVIAEMFLEGTLFTLSQLFKYREGEYKVDAALAVIEDRGVQDLIKQMIHVNPSNRPTFDTLLHSSRGSVFPESFYSFLYNYAASLNELSSEAVSSSTLHSQTGTPLQSTGFSSVGLGGVGVNATVRSTVSSSATTFTGTTSTATVVPGTVIGGTEATATTDLLPSDSDHRVERIWADYESVEAYITSEASVPPSASAEEEVRAGVKTEPRRNEVEMERVKVEYVPMSGPSSRSSGKAFQDILPVELHIPNHESNIQASLRGRRCAAAEDGPALIILSILTANIRNCTLPSSKLKTLDVFLALASHLTDEAKLDRMVPFVVELLNDEAAVVRLGAVRCLMQVLMLVTVITPSNVSIFPEYIIPNIKHLVHDPEVSVRCSYAQCMSGLADTAVRYLEMGQALKAHGAFKLARGTVTGEVAMGVGVGEYESAYFEMSYDANMQELQSHIQEHLSTLLIDPSSTVKRAVLHDISSLCIFLGRQKTNDVLLSHMITYLNDRDWLLRYTFFESVVDVAACAGGRSLEEYILPLMVQALSDVEESVVARVLSALTSLCELGLFQKMRIWELMSATLGFLYHPNIWIRQGAAAFITAAGQHLPPSDIWCILYPSLRHFTKSDILTIDESGLLTALKSPLPRQVLDVSVQWAMKAEKSTFWRAGVRRVGTGMNQSRGDSPTPRESIMAMRKGGSSGIGKNRSEEDEVQLSKLHQLGMTPSDENKLLAMRDYIVKLANATASFASRINYGYGYAGEVDGVKNVESLKVVGGDVELQKLGVVPQTVFLKMGGTTMRSNGRMSHVPPSRRSTMTMRTPVMSPRLGNSRRMSGGDSSTSTGAPFEDLRRRLATINNGSTLSVQSSTTSRHPLLSPATASSSSTPSLPPTVPPDGNMSTTAAQHSGGGISTSTSSSDDRPRPPSPSESVVSTTSVSLRPTSRLQVGSTDNQKAAPAVGSSRANATGLLEAHYKIRSEEGGLYGGSGLGSVHEESGRSTPSVFSMSQTLRAGTGLGMGQRQRGPSSLAISTYDGQEPGISHLLENLYLDNNKDLQQDFGPKVHEGPVRRRNVTRSTFSTRDSSSSSSARRIDANLIADLSSHSEAITGLAVSPDHMFFVSSSDDKTVKVWDTVRLERNVTSKPRQTYGQHHAKVKCVCVLEGVHCFASAAEDGSLHVVRVHVAVSGAGALPKYSRLQVVREHRVENVGEYIVAMMHYNTDTQSTLVYATTHSTIVILDLRTMSILQTMENPRHYGPITSFCIDKKRAWIVVGTSTGVLTLWDKRFGLLLRTWRAGVTGEGQSTGRSVRIHQCVVHPSSRSRGKWVMVALSLSPALARKNNVGRPSSCLIEVWNIEKAALVETYVTRTGSASDPVSELLSGGTVGQEVETTAAVAISALVRSSQESGTSDDFGDTTAPPLDVPHPHCDIRAMVVGSDFGVYMAHQRPEFGELDMIPGSSSSRSSGRGFVVSGSEDAKIRLWDLGKFEKSTVLSGTESDLEKPSYSTSSSPNPSEANHVASFVETWPLVPPSSSSTRASQRISLITHSQQQLLKNHQDVVTALTCIDSPFRGGIVSGDRAGVIKVWRVEQIDH